MSGNVAFNTSVGGGAVDTVKLYSRADGATDWYLLASDTTSPYGATWATNPWVADGAYELKAEAWKGTVLKATGTLRVLVKNAAASVSFSSPTSGATVSLQASVSGATVEGVRFYSRTSSAPFDLTWATSPWVADGRYELKAEAYRAGSLVASKVITVAVQNADTTPPLHSPSPRRRTAPSSRATSPSPPTRATRTASPRWSSSAS